MKGEIILHEFKFYIPKDQKIPTELMMYVDNVFVIYEKEAPHTFLFTIFDRRRFGDIAEAITDQMERDHDESEFGISWETVSGEFLPLKYETQEYREYRWVYRVRDSY